MKIGARSLVPHGEHFFVHLDVATLVFPGFRRKVKEHVRFG